MACSFSYHLSSFLLDLLQSPLPRYWLLHDSVEFFFLLCEEDVSCGRNTHLWERILVKEIQVPSRKSVKVVKEVDWVVQHYGSRARGELQRKADLNCEVKKAGNYTGSISAGIWRVCLHKKHEVVIAKGGGGEGNGELFNGYKIAVMQDEKAL